MKRQEVKNKFDEIVDFSGVEKFINTPVKHYSSGMKVRLAFSVAAHLEPEILLIDEVLAVGDAEFQKRCLGKMERVAKDGRTVLFVSHNLEAVKNLCSKSIVIDNGELIDFTEISLGIERYNNLIDKSVINEGRLLDFKRENWKQEILFEKLVFRSKPIEFGETIAIEVLILNRLFPKVFDDVEFAFSIRNSIGIGSTLIHGSTKFIGSNFSIHTEQKILNIEIPNNLRPGKYYLTLFIREKGNIQDWLTDISSFFIEEGSPYSWSNISEIQGLTFPDYKIHV
jgi:lipopolysaccharide transport system ATP-binding protein